MHEITSLIDTEELRRLADTIGDAQTVFFKTINESALFDSHPFNLPTHGWSIDGMGWRDRRAHLLASVTDTRASILAMQAVSLYLLQTRERQRHPAPYLRVVKESGFAFFEIGCNAGIFICGIRADSSAEAEIGARELKDLFILLAVEWNVPIEQATMPDASQFETGLKTLRARATA